MPERPVLARPDGTRHPAFRHPDLDGRDEPDQHPAAAIGGLAEWLAAHLDPGSNITLTENEDGTITIASTGGSGGGGGTGDTYSYQTFSNTDVTVATTAIHTVVQQTGVISTTDRTVTLPLAASVPAGAEVVVNVGNLQNGHGVTISRQGSDVLYINYGAFTYTINDPFSGQRFISDGAGRWSADNPAVLTPNGNLYNILNMATARQNLGLEIGVNVQAYDTDLALIAALTTTSFGRAFLTLADAAAARAAMSVDPAGTAAGLVAALSATVQPVDSDLTAIAALATTSYGRSLLTLSNQAALIAASSQWTEVGRATTTTTNVWPSFSSVPTADRYQLIVVKDPASVPASSGGIVRNLTINFDSDTTSGHYFNTGTSAAAVSVACLPQGGSGAAVIDVVRARITSTVYGAIVRALGHTVIGGGNAAAINSGHSYHADSGVPPLTSWSLAASNNDAWAAGYTFILRTANMP